MLYSEQTPMPLPLLPIPEPVIEPEEEEELVEEIIEEQPEPEVQSNAGDDMSDMFAPPSPDDEDMATEDLFEVSEEDMFGEGGDDMSDLFDVSNEDIMGNKYGQRPTTPKRRIVRRVRQLPRRYVLPPSMGGIRP